MNRTNQQSQVLDVILRDMQRLEAWNLVNNIINGWDPGQGTDLEATRAADYNHHALRLEVKTSRSHFLVEVLQNGYWKLYQDDERDEDNKPRLLNRGSAEDARICTVHIACRTFERSLWDKFEAADKRRRG